MTKLHAFFNSTRPGSPFLFVLCLMAVFAIGWGNGYQSCLRTNGIRTALVIYYNGQGYQSG